MKKSLLIQEEILALGDVSSSNIRTHLKIRRFFYANTEKIQEIFQKHSRYAALKKSWSKKKFYKTHVLYTVMAKLGP